MKFETLHIYGYGKLENREIDLSHLTVLYGENEAGKSTIRSFIKSILFGFPTRGQRRYEPKDGGKYGGAITVLTKEYGRVKIERLPKTAVGEVTVYFDDGKTGDEDVLQQLLHGMNEKLFDSIFSFDMHGLQNIHRVGEADIGNYLFSASAVGGDGILQLEKMLDKEMEQRFKASGRKPEINVSLQELKGLQDELATWQGKIETYESVVKQKKEAEDRLVELRAEQQEASKRKQDYEVLQTLQPLFVEKLACERFLAEHDGHAFPADGLKRYEALQVRMEPLALQGSMLHKKIASAQNEIQSLQVNEELLEQEEYIEELRMQQMSYENAQQEVRDITNNLVHIEEEISELQQQIGVAFTREEVLSFNMNLATKEAMTAFMQKGTELEKRKVQLDDRFKLSQEQLEEQEETVKRLKHEMMPEEERERYLSSVQSAASNQRQSRSGAGQKKPLVSNTMLQSLFLFNGVLLLAGLFFNYRPLLFVSIFLLVGLVLFYVIFMKQPVQTGENTEQLEKRYLLEKDDEIRKRLEHEMFKLQQLERGYDRIISEYEEWERDMFSIGEQVELYQGIYKLPKSFTYAHMLPAFERIEKMQQLYREQVKQTERKELQQDMISQFEHKLMKLTVFSDRSAEAPSLFLHSVSKELQKEKEKQLKRKQLIEKVAALKEEFDEVQQQMIRFTEERANLFQIAGVTEEEDYFSAAKKADEIAEKKKQLHQLLPQIDLLQERLTTDVLSDGYRPEGYEEESFKEEQRLEQLGKEEKTLTETAAKLKLEIAALEDGKAYGDLLHEWEMKVSNLRQQVKKWATFAVAKSVLTKTKKYYHEVQLPRILQKAEEYFIYLTDENYTKVFSPSAEEPFIVVRKDGTQFYSDELSQATAEQLYLSLRFALANTFEHVYPFIIDDGFVHFDEGRTKRTIQLIKKFAAERQVIFFTCHAHLLSLFEEEQVKRLSS
ncbi:hypothetical protein BAMA_16660 [Bacillus manliponensis]|uniref:YhaN AAA domain-containing protein n=1 Tax=Bacillus manliponensis TaxID=574376 RepID=A0A073K0Q8_9BACI|nr:AAA family ATPase [Bacillus manliponensis]KEK20085.1 hypothetical protein BAMA_16660 [Bacillus manliponensis]